MKKRIIIVHGWDGYPEANWFPWLKLESEKRGFEVLVPQLPEPESPRIYNWVPKLAETVGKVDENTFFIGHSLGCQTIARYLESTSSDTKAGGVIFVGGYFKHLDNLEKDRDVEETEKHWLATPIDLDRVKGKIGISVAIFSDDDPYVPLDNQDDFREKLGSEIIIQHGMKHFSSSTGTTELPVALNQLLKISGS